MDNFNILHIILNILINLSSIDCAYYGGHRNTATILRRDEFGGDRLRRGRSRSRSRSRSRYDDYDSYYPHSSYYDSPLYYQGRQEDNMYRIQHMQQRMAEEQYRIRREYISEMIKKVSNYNHQIDLLANLRSQLIQDGILPHMRFWDDTNHTELLEGQIYHPFMKVDIREDFYDQFIANRQFNQYMQIVGCRNIRTEPNFFNIGQPPH